MRSPVRQPRRPPGPVEIELEPPVVPVHHARVRGRNLLLLLLCVVLAAVLRGGQLGGFAITHWDEGLAWRGARYFLSLGREGHYSPTHGPPLLSMALAAWARLFGADPGSAVWLNVGLSTAAIPLAAWTAHQVAGPRAGLLAGLLFAISGLHAMFARTLLAESAYAFFLLLSLGLSLRALERPAWPSLLAVGCAVACTQATKYNGCLAAVPLGTALLLRALRGGEPGRWTRLVWQVAIVAIPVLLCMGGNLVAIARVGDLDAFLEHYRGYVGQGSDPRTVLATLAWVVPYGVLGAALLGVLVPPPEATGRPEWPQREGRLVLGVALVLYTVFLLRYSFYLRLLVPVATLLLLFAALGLDGLARRIERAFPRRAAWAASGWFVVMVAAIGGQAWARAERHYLRAFDGYVRASAWLNAQADRPPTLIAGQDFVWSDLTFDAPVVGLPSTRARELLEQGGTVQLVTDVGAFSRLRPWSLEPVFERLLSEHHVRSFDATLNLDALQNNLEFEELRRLPSDAALRERVLEIHVFRLEARELLALVDPGH